MQIQREWDGEIIVNHGANTARGVAILLHSRLECSVKQKRCDNEGRTLNIVLELENHTLNIINIYAPQRTANVELFSLAWAILYPRILIISLVVTTTV